MGREDTAQKQRRTHIFYKATAESVITGLGADGIHSGFHPTVAIYYPDLVRGNMVAIAQQMTRECLKPTLHLVPQGELTDLMVLFHLPAPSRQLMARLFRASPELQETLVQIGEQCQLLASGEVYLEKDSYWYGEFLKSFEKTGYVSIKLVGAKDQSAEILWQTDIVSYEVEYPSLV